MTIICLLSGGMDSTTLAYQLRADNPDEHLITLGFDYRQRHTKELRYAATTADTLSATNAVIRLPELGPSALTDNNTAVPEGHYTDDTMRATVVPNRNMVMLSVAVSYAVTTGARAVYTAVHAGDRAIYPDCRPEFIHAASVAARLGNEGYIDPIFHIVAPYTALTKTDIATLGQHLDVPWQTTWTCYVGGDTHCGRCGACVERREALATYDDPTEYAP